MRVPVLNMQGEKIETIDLPASIFEANVNVGLMHQAYVRQQANARAGTQVLYPEDLPAKGNRSGAARRPQCADFCRRWCCTWPSAA